MANLDNIEAKAFYKELDDIELHLPGNKRGIYSENRILLDLFGEQYRRWKEKRKITSVPVARIPKMFLHNTQMEKELEKQQKCLIKGDEAEQKLYRLFVEGSFHNQPGMIIFPNVDGNHFFKSQVGRVEMDLVLIHPKKGIFVFSVKNVGMKLDSLIEKIKQEIEKHSRFVRMIKDYRPVSNNHEVPIHTVVCDFRRSPSDLMRLEEGEISAFGKVFVLNKDELKPDAFSQVLASKVFGGGISDITWNDSFDLLAARLTALASLEGASVLIQEKMRQGILQSGFKKCLQTQIGPHGDIDGLKDIVAQHSEIRKHKGNRRFILWTKDQMRVIAKVYWHLVKSPERGLRLLVTGGKGSGKTLLLVFLAKMVQSVVKPTSENVSNKVLVYEGSLSSVRLRTMLQEVFASTNIVVPGVPGQLLLTPESGLMSRSLEDIRFVFCDETLPRMHGIFLKHLSEYENCVLFSSDRTSFVDSRFTVMHLGNNLRSTNQIASFANKYIDRGPKNIFLSCPAHTFHGESVEVRFAHEKDETSERGSEDPSWNTKKRRRLENNQEDDHPFVVRSIEAVQELAAEPDFDFIIIPLVDATFFQQLVQKLENNYTCNVDPKLPYSNVTNSSRRDRSNAVIEFFHPHTVEGCEFSKVLILVDASIFEMSAFTDNGDLILTALTRATLKVVFVVKYFEIPNDKYVEDVLVKVHTEKIMKVFDDIQNSGEPSVLFVGNLPVSEDFSGKYKPIFQNETISVPEVEGILLYQGPHGVFFYLENLFLESECKKMVCSGISQIIFTDENVSCVWTNFFYVASSLCCEKISRQYPNAVKFGRYTYNIDLMKFQINFHLALWQQQSGDSRAVYPEFWLDLENQPTPVSEEHNWYKWKSLADELYRLGEFPLAFMMFECAIKLLQNKVESTKQTNNYKQAEALRKNLTELLTSAAQKYTKSWRQISKESTCREAGYWVQTIHVETCLMKAFRHAINALQIDQLSATLEQIRKTFDEIRSYSNSDFFKAWLLQLNQAENIGWHCDKFQHKILDASSSTHSDFHAKLHILESQMLDYRTKRGERNSSKFSRTQISLMARNLATECLDSSVSETHVPNQLLMIQCRKQQLIRLLDYPVQLGMVAVHWEPSTENFDTLSKALNELEKEIDRVKCFMDHEIEITSRAKMTIEDPATSLEKL